MFCWHLTFHIEWHCFYQTKFIYFRWFFVKFNFVILLNKWHLLFITTVPMYVYLFFSYKLLLLYVKRREISWVLLWGMHFKWIVLGIYITQHIYLYFLSGLFFIPTFYRRLIMTTDKQTPKFHHKVYYNILSSEPTV